MRNAWNVSLLCAAVVASGCASLTPQKVVGEPSEVTVEQALKSVGDGLREMRLAIGEIGDLLNVLDGNGIRPMHRQDLHVKEPPKQ